METNIEVGDEQYPFARKTHFPNVGVDLPNARRHEDTKRRGVPNEAAKGRKKAPPRPHGSAVNFLTDYNIPLEEAEQRLFGLGISGLQYGNYVPDYERPKHVRLLAQSIDRLRQIGIPDDSFVGLGVSFGGRGRGKASAHYEPTRQIINLTRDNIGSFGHEFGHHLDYRKAAVKVQGGGWYAFSRVFQEAVLESGYIENFCSKVPATQWRYWLRPTEIFARSFNCWLYGHFQDLPYLCHEPATDVSDPNHSEREIIFAAIEKMMPFDSPLPLAAGLIDRRIKELKKKAAIIARAVKDALNASSYEEIGE